MSVICFDVNGEVTARYGPRCAVNYVVTRDLLYADDTLLAETDATVLQFHLDRMVQIGGQYGLELHWGKTCVLNIRHPDQIMGPEGPLKEEAEAVYLGGLISADGCPTRELTRRIGEAEGTFQKLMRVWRHSNIPRQRKRQIYEACVVSKLMYGIETVWLRKHERARLDAYHVRCLRRIYGIAPSYYSRLSNQAVLIIAESTPMSSTLLRRQLIYFGRVARMAPDNPARQLLLQRGSVQLRAAEPGRRRGRPRQQWGSCVHAHAVAAAGSAHLLHECLITRGQRSNTDVDWRSIVDAYVQ